MNFFVLLILIVIFIAFINLSKYSLSDEDRRQLLFEWWYRLRNATKNIKNVKVRKEFLMKAYGAIIGLVVVLLLIVTFGWVNVHPTEVAVEINKIAGKISEAPKGVGYHFYNRWITDMVIYKVSARAYPSDTIEASDSKKYSLELKTNDGQNVQVDLTIIYALDPNNVPLLHQQIGVNYADQVLLPQIRSEARLAIGQYSAEEIYQGKVRDEMQQVIRQKLADVLAKYPAIKIHDALIRHFAFSPDFEKAIEQKKLAAQQVEINKNKAAAEEQEAFRKENQAKGEKLKAIQEAEGRAQSAKIEADAQRYKLEQEASGNLAIYKAEAEGKKLLADALGGGQNVVALRFADKIPDKLQIWGIPTGQQNTSLMDVSGIFGDMFKKKD